MDGDVLGRGVPRVWRPVVDALRTHADARSTGELIHRALADELRSRRGGLRSGPIGRQLRRRKIDPAGAVVADVLEALEDRVGVFADPIVCEQVGSAYDTWDKAQHHLGACVAHASLIHLAGSAVKHPDGHGVRRRRRPKMSTVELLGSPAPTPPSS